MPFDPTDERERTPWRAAAPRRWPQLPASFEGRLLFVGILLVIIDALHLLRSVAGELTSLVMMPISAVSALVRWLAAWW